MEPIFPEEIPFSSSTLTLPLRQTFINWQSLSWCFEVGMLGWLVSYRFVPVGGLPRYSTVPSRSHCLSGILMCTLGYRTSTVSNTEGKKRPEHDFHCSRNLFSYSGKRYFMVINGSNVNYFKLHCHSLIIWKVLPPSEEQKPLHFTTSAPLVRDLKACEITIAQLLQ